MNKLRVGVVGVGYLGGFHAKTYQEIESCSLVGVSDTNNTRLSEISRSLNIPGYGNHQDLFDKVDAVSITVPTILHHKIALDFLRNNKHILVEKPFTINLKEASSLIKEAKKRKLTLQVGHIERFNSAFSATKKIINNPQFIECHRLSIFPKRSLDVGVVLDIMIHDIDIILGLVDSRIRRIESLGVKVLTNFEDIANARITFANGCVANLTASRISDEVMRKIRIFQENTYISLDYKAAEACVYRKGRLNITKESLPIEEEQPLKKELESFIDCVKHHKQPIVSGPVASQALAVALKIGKQICRKGKS
ncbi:MAG: Gfo/Idh/MocA family oxidoreductase [Candidatus Omnitrophota bacterium]